MLVGSLRGEFERQVGDEELRLPIRYVGRLRGPHDGRPLAGETLFDHLPDAGLNTGLVAGHGLGLLFDQQRDVGVLLEAVAHAIEVQVQAPLLEFLQARLDGGAVEIRPDARAEQVGLADAWRK